MRRKGPPVPGVRIEETPVYRAGQGPPLLLLHGASVTWRSWKPVLPLLEAHHDVIALTMLGHSGGALRPAGEPLSISTLVDHVVDELDRLGLDKVHVAGNSLGGWVALELARRQRAQTVTAFSPGGAWRSQRRYRAMGVSMSAGMALVGVLGDRTDRIAHSPRLRRAFGSLACEHPERIDPDELLADLRALRETQVMTRLMPALGATPLQPIPAGTCPIRIVWASHDRVVPYRHFGAPLMERLPEAELIFLDGVGHIPMIDKPREVAGLITGHTLRGSAGVSARPL